MITQEDRDAAQSLAKWVFPESSLWDELPEWEKAFAAHRIAAEKAVLDRLRNLPDDAKNYVVATLPSCSRFIEAADVALVSRRIADILEQQP